MIGTISKGIKMPIIRQGDDLMEIILSNITELQDDDVICITESIVARAQGNYVSIDDIVNFFKNKFPNVRTLELKEPIMSRNRFSLILRAFARAVDKIYINHRLNVDTQGNPIYGVNPYTGVNIVDYYKQIGDEEKCAITFVQDIATYSDLRLDASCHPTFTYGLKHIMNIPTSLHGYNEDWGLLGSNKANENTLKLFPRKQEAQKLCDDIQAYILDRYNVKVHVLVYGDGCFKSPGYPSIWEFADPVTCPAYTKELDSIMPNEIKLKAFADDKFANLSGQELTDAIVKEINSKDSNLVGNMNSQGTTPRKVTDLLASLADLTSGSGDKGTPVVVISNYFSHY